MSHYLAKLRKQLSVEDQIKMADAYTAAETDDDLKYWMNIPLVNEDEFEDIRLT